MNKSYTKINIKNIILDKQYSINKHDLKLKVSIDGIDIKLSSLNNIRKVSDVDFNIQTLPEYYYNFYSSLNINQRIDAELLLGKKKIKDYLLYVKDSIRSSKDLVTSYHTEIFNKRKKVYQDLNTVSLDNNLLALPTYNHSSLTGRTSITKGHNFLTMKKTERKRIQPISDNDMLVEVDFKSCEPFFYLKSIGILKEETDDVYKYIAELIGYDIKSRDRFKRAILSIMYGATNNSIKKLSGISENKIQKIKDIMKIKETEDYLSKEFEKNSFFCNFYGRPILKNNNLINYWIQSSAVDFCSLAFSKFIKDYNLRPAFFVHDSMSFLINKDRRNEISLIKALEEPISGISIPVEIVNYQRGI
tara:strand:+ start:1033 stop:2115 length:1083 start_codon:yes stop_codon:yes gene_type:complete